MGELAFGATLVLRPVAYPRAENSAWFAFCAYLILPLKITFAPEMKRIVMFSCIIDYERWIERRRERRDWQEKAKRTEDGAEMRAL